MPFDPAQPAFKSPLASATMRSQFLGLRDEYTSLITAIPAGPQGDPGEKGDKGDQGEPGETGPQGPPFANAVVDAVNTLNAGEPAAVVVGFDGTLVHFTFSIPQGANGEVTLAQLDTAIATTAKNPADFPPFTGTFSDPVTQAEMQAFATYVENFRQFMSR